MVVLERASTWERQFVQEGFVVVPGNFPPRHMEECTRAMEAVISRAEELGRRGVVRIRKSERATTEGVGWSWGCDHIFRPELRDQRLLDLASAPPFPEVLRLILGASLRFTGGHGHWSPQNGDYYLHWHRDSRRERWQVGNPDVRCHVQLCLALQEEAVVRLVPGSHVRDLSHEELSWVMAEPHGTHPHQVIPFVPAGSALLLNTYTLHRAQCARTTPRRSLHFGFTRVGAAPEPGRPGHVQHWARDPAFRAAQTPFLRAAIDAQANSEV